MVDWRQIRVSHSPITASLFHSKMYIQKNSLLDPSELFDKFVSRRIKKIEFMSRRGALHANST